MEEDSWLSEESPVSLEVTRFRVGQILAPDEVSEALLAGHMVMRRPNRIMIPVFWEMRGRQAVGY